MSKKSSAALAEAIPTARASARRQKIESARPEPLDDEPIAVEGDAEDEAAPASTVADGELVVLDEEFDFEEATAEVEETEGDSVPAPAKKRKGAADEGGGDTMLARYFREMATHPVMGPHEELGTAVSVESAEVAQWCAILNYLPVVELALDALERDLPKDEEAIDLPQIAELRKYYKLYKKQHNKLTREQEKKHHLATESLARAIRLADSDRLWIAHAEDVVRRTRGGASRRRPRGRR